MNASESIKGFVYLHKFFLLKNNQESEYILNSGVIIICIVQNRLKGRSVDVSCLARRVDGCGW